MQTNSITDGVSCFCFCSFFTLTNTKPNPQLSSTHRSPSPANRPQSVHYPGGGGGGGGSGSGVGGGGGGIVRSTSRLQRPGAAEGGGWDNLGCDVPPPLPARNRSLVSHNSSPLIMSSPVPGETPSSPPPPLPPRNPSNASSSSCSSSSSSSSSSAAAAPGMPDLVPSANGASQDQHRTALHDSPTNQPSSTSVSNTDTQQPLQHLTTRHFSHWHASCIPHEPSFYAFTVELATNNVDYSTMIYHVKTLQFSSMLSLLSCTLATCHCIWLI